MNDTPPPPPSSSPGSSSSEPPSSSPGPDASPGSSSSEPPSSSPGPDASPGPSSSAERSPSPGPDDPPGPFSSAEPSPSAGRPRPSRLASFRNGFRRASGYSPDLTPGQQITRRTFVSFSVFTLLGAAAWKSWFWLKDSMPANGVQNPLRKGLDVDGKVFKHTLSPNHLAPTWPVSAGVRNVRYNGGIGLDAKGFDAAAWQLQVTTLDNRPLSVGLDELQRLPLTEFAFEFKCIEGWSQISSWGGVKFSDFINHFGLQKEASLAYAGFSTPDGEYYVGLDMPSAMHPQTLLCYQMNGKPLEPRHGAPLRLIIPIKYGVKSLKRIGHLYFSNDRPRDYWFERGYDYYCGL